MKLWLVHPIEPLPADAPTRFVFFTEEEAKAYADPRRCYIDTLQTADEMETDDQKMANSILDRQRRALGEATTEGDMLRLWALHRADQMIRAHLSFALGTNADRLYAFTLMPTTKEQEAAT